MESPSTCSCSEPKASRMARASSTPHNDWEAFVRAQGYIIKCVLWVLGRQSGDQGRNLIPNVAEVALQDRNINHKQNHMKHHETRCTLAQGIYPIWNPVLIWSKKLKMNMLSGMNVKRKTTSSMTSSWCLMCVCVCVCHIVWTACSRQHCNTCPVTKPDLNSMCLTSRSKAPCWISPNTCCLTFSCHISLLFPSLGFKYALQKFNGVFCYELQSMFSLRVFMWFLFLEDARPHFFKPIFCPESYSERHNT